MFKIQNVNKKKVNVLPCYQEVLLRKNPGHPLLLSGNHFLSRLPVSPLYPFPLPNHQNPENVFYFLVARTDRTRRKNQHVDQNLSYFENHLRPLSFARCHFPDFFSKDSTFLLQRLSHTVPWKQDFLHLSAILENAINLRWNRLCQVYTKEALTLFVSAVLSLFLCDRRSICKRKIKENVWNKLWNIALTLLRSFDVYVAI